MLFLSKIVRYFRMQSISKKEVRHAFFLKHNNALFHCCIGLKMTVYVRQKYSKHRNAIRQLHHILLSVSDTCLIQQLYFFVVQETEDLLYREQCSLWVLCSTLYSYSAIQHAALHFS